MTNFTNKNIVCKSKLNCHKFNMSAYRLKLEQMKTLIKLIMYQTVPFLWSQAEVVRDFDCKLETNDHGEYFL